MKRPKSEPPGARRFKLSHLLLGIAAPYLIFVSLRFSYFLEIVSGDDTDVGPDGLTVGESRDEDLNRPLYTNAVKDSFHRRLEDNEIQNVPSMPQKKSFGKGKGGLLQIKPLQHPYGRITGEIARQRNGTSDLSVMERMAGEAWALGLKAWEEIDKYDEQYSNQSSKLEGKNESCPSSVSMSGEELAKGDEVMFLPCGLAAGSSITVIGTPHYAHQEYIPQIARLRTADALVLVSQFMFELQGLKSVVGEDPPKILHLNPRLRGDWSHLSVIEHNTCYRMQWGNAQRCDGSPSRNNDDVLGNDLIYLFYF